MNSKVLTLDLGNSNATIGEFEGQKLKRILSLEKALEEINQLKNYPLVISSVRHDLPSIITQNFGNTIDPRLDFKNSQFLDMPVHYGNTLGSDRLLASFYIFKMMASQAMATPCLIVDAGTFATFDLVTSDGHFGGPIFPGIELLEKCYLSGNKLWRPDLMQMGLQELTQDLKHSPPQDTKAAIHAGILLFIRGALSQAIKLWEPKKIIFTGGHGQQWQEIFNASPDDAVYSVSSEVLPYLVHFGLMNYQHFSLSKMHASLDGL